MKYSTLAIMAAALVGANAASFTSSDWQIYTKPLGSTTITVTNYVGTGSLGEGYTTDTILVSQNGVLAYTKYNTRPLNSAELASISSVEAVSESSVEAAEAASSAAAAAQVSSSSTSTTGDGWVTYTKDLGSSTIVVTRYVGTTELTGTSYTTRVITKLDSAGNPQYTETIVGLATADASSAAASSAVASLTETSSTVAETSAAESSVVAESSVAESSAVAETSAAESSAVESAEPSASEESATPSASESAVPSSTDAPSFVGSYNGGSPKWTLGFPGTLGPWTGISISFARGETDGEFDFTSAVASIDGVETSAASIDVADDSVTITFDQSIEDSSEVVFEILARIVSGAAWTSNAHIELTTADGAKLVKRATESWDLSSTIEEDASVSSSEDAAASASSSEAASSEAAASSVISSQAYTNGTSTVTEDDISTTVVTVTSCSDNACSETAVTTGVTVVTLTSEGVVTEYTTYCPLTSEATSEATSKATTKASTAASTEATTKAETTAPKSEDTTSTQTVVSTSTEGAVSTFEGAAAAVGVSIGALALAAAALF